MKKYLITILVLLAMLVIQVGSVAAAGTATLVSVEYGYKGPIFTFSVSGKFSRAELKGSLHVENGADYSLHCTQVDETTVKCTTSDKVAGVNVVVTWGGSTFWAYVPKAPPPPAPVLVSDSISDPDTIPTEYCYSIWDYWFFTNWEWVDFGPHCQDTSASEGDVILYTVPDPDGSFEAPVVFLNEGPECATYGPAYYWPWCPE